MEDFQIFSKPVSVFVNYLKLVYKKEQDELLCQKVVRQPSFVNTLITSGPLRACVTKIITSGVQFCMC